jgi:IclR family mhp operon transcriptional activator
VLLRGLTVLEALNRRPVSTVEQVAEATRLPKPTVVRMLGQLAAAGYVQRLPKRRGYVLDERVLALSGGFRSHDALVSAALPVMFAFTAEHKWPVSIATLEVDAMRVRATTLEQSPYATPGDRGRIARRVPILASALGRAYLAFCPDDERNTILALLGASGRKYDQPARDQRFVSSLVSSVRRAGYAVSSPVPGDPAVGIAVPIRSGTDIVACISLRYLGKAISESEVARRHLPHLQAVADEIALLASRG